MKKEILKNRPLFNECIDALNAYVLPQEKSDQISLLFDQIYPLTKWGKVDWEKINKKKFLKSDSQKIIPTIHELLDRPFDKEVYIEWSDGSLPVIQANLENIVSFFDDVTCVTFDKFIFNFDERYIIEIRPGDVITVGIIASH